MNITSWSRKPARLLDWVRTSVDRHIASYKLCLPLVPQDGGGSRSFIRTLRDYLDRIGYSYTDNLGHRYEAVLVCAWITDYERIQGALHRNPGLKVIHRVDGSGRDYGRFDDGDERLAKINTLADLTVFQSHYSRFSTTVKYCLIKQDGPIIYNPTSTALFSPDGPRIEFGPGVRVCNAAWSSNPMKGTIHIPRLAEENRDVHFVLCGSYNAMPDLPNIHLLGVVSPTEVARAMRSCDVFLTLAQNDPCSNAVIEALASGLPVLYKDSGGNPELVGDCGLPVEVDSFRTQLDQAMARKEELSRMARERAVRVFSTDVVCPQYLKAIEGLLV